MSAFLDPNSAAPVILESVVIRSIESQGRPNREDAWVAMGTRRGTVDVLVPIADFKADDHGDEAWARAAKYGRRLADRLTITYKKKRATAFQNLEILL